MDDEAIKNLGSEIFALIQKYEGLPPAEVGNALITHAVIMLLFAAPDELVGIKTIMACIEIGISEYEKNCS